MFFRRRCAVIALAVGLGIGSVGLALPAAPAHATPRYPSWEEVQAGRSTTESARAESARVRALIDDLGASSERASIDALVAAEAAREAGLARDRSRSGAERLATELAEARERSAAAGRDLGAVIAQLVRAGAPGLSSSLATDSGADGDLLYQLGAMEKLTAQQHSRVDTALRAANEVTALEAQAAAIAVELARDSESADRALREAEAASERAAAALGEQRERGAELGAQLALLEDSGAALEDLYAQGVAAAAAARAEAERVRAEAAEAARAQAAAEARDREQARPPAARPPGGAVRPQPVAPSGPGSGGGTATPPRPGPPVGGSAAAASAVAFAHQQLGKWYRLGGAGPTVWDCSGLTMMAYRQAGINVGAHSVGAQYRHLSAINRLAPVSGGMVPGDLLFYNQGGGTNSRSMYHVTLYIGGGRMIEAPEPGRQVLITPVRTRNLVPYVGRPAG